MLARHAARTAAAEEPPSAEAPAEASARHRQASQTAPLPMNLLGPDGSLIL